MTSLPSLARLALKDWINVTNKQTSIDHTRWAETQRSPFKVLLHTGRNGVKFRLNALKFIKKNEVFNYYHPLPKLILR